MAASCQNVSLPGKYVRRFAFFMVLWSQLLRCHSYHSYVCNIVDDTRRLIVIEDLDVRKASQVSGMIVEPKEMSDLVTEYGKIVPSSSK